MVLKKLRAEAGRLRGHKVLQQGLLGQDLAVQSWESGVHGGSRYAKLKVSMMMSAILSVLLANFRHRTVNKHLAPKHTHKRHEELFSKWTLFPCWGRAEDVDTARLGDNKADMLVFDSIVELSMESVYWDLNFSSWTTPHRLPFQSYAYKCLLAPHTHSFSFLCPTSSLSQRF